MNSKELKNTNEAIENAIYDAMWYVTRDATMIPTWNVIWLATRDMVTDTSTSEASGEFLNEI